MLPEVLLTSGLVSAAVTALVGPLVFHLLKQREERRRKTFDIRYAEYKHYLKALESLSSTSHADFEVFMKSSAQKCLTEILSGDSEPPRLSWRPDGLSQAATMEV
jgi:hypothetical protein